MPIAEKYVLYDRGAYLDLIDDKEWLGDAERLWGRPLTPPELEREVDDVREHDLDDEVYNIGCSFDKRVKAAHPEWGGYAIMASGSVGRWNGASVGHNYYASFDDLIDDDGYDGIFKDCEIDSIWEDRSGTLHVDGVHHDGRVSVAVKAVPPDMEERESSMFKWNGDLDEENAALRRMLLSSAWDDGVNAGMSSEYGFIWPTVDETAAPSEVAATVFRGSATGARVDGFDIEGPVATRGGERFELDLVTGEFAYFIAPDADEAAGVAMFRLGADAPARLASDNWLASDAYSKDVDRIAAGDLHPAFAGPNARAAIEAAKEQAKAVKTDMPSWNAVAGKARVAAARSAAASHHEATAARHAL